MPRSNALTDLRGRTAQCGGCEIDTRVSRLEGTSEWVQRSRRVTSSGIQAQVQSSKEHNAGQEDVHLLEPEGKLAKGANALQNYVASDFWEALSQEVGSNYLRLTSKISSTTDSRSRPMASAKSWKSLKMKIPQARIPLHYQGLERSHIPTQKTSSSATALLAPSLTPHKLSRSR